MFRMFRDCWPGSGARRLRSAGKVRLLPGRTRDHGEMEVSRGGGSAIAVEVAGPPGGRPVLVCHGLADARLSVRLFEPAARELGLRLVAPDRPGTGRTGPRGLGRLADWAEDAALVLDAAAAGPAALLGISAGGPFAAACAARLGGRVHSLTLIAPLGAPGWPVREMAPGQRLALAAARRAQALVGWFLGRLAVLARHSPRLFAAAIPGAQLQLHPGHGHFSILGAAREILAPLAALAGPTAPRPRGQHELPGRCYSKLADRRNAPPGPTQCIEIHEPPICMCPAVRRSCRIGEHMRS
jgi:pimeloyl-ACP methyl ester carboxylesterase